MVHYGSDVTVIYLVMNAAVRVDRMASTVDINHANMLERFRVLGNVRDIASDVVRWPQLELRVSNQISTLIDDIDKIMHDYEINSIAPLQSYHDTGSGAEYFQYLDNSNMARRLDQCGAYIANVLGVLKAIGPTDDSKCDSVDNIRRTDAITLLQKCVDGYDMYRIYVAPVEVCEFELCDCGTKMIWSKSQNEMICCSCGEIKNIPMDAHIGDGVVWNGHHERGGIKHGKYEPIRRCRFWLERIQGTEIATIEDECIEAIKKCIARDTHKGMRPPDPILCSQFRTYLKQTGYTIYNDHVVLIRKMITGYQPPSLTDEERQIVYNVFNKVITVFDNIKPGDKCNSPYYPYFMGKILYAILRDSQRRRRILECIHMQSSTTLVANDKLMQQICERIAELEYTPTITDEFTIKR